ncbi:MAG: mannosyltransferase family protein [Solirubrobacteraceae bacterium]
MSATASTAAHAPDTARMRARALLRSRSVTLSLTAFAASRLLVLAAGAIGVLALNKHDGSSAAAALHALGPVGNVLAGSVDRFDATYYLEIAAHGYGPASAHLLAFFPLYPLLIRLLTPLTASAVIAGAGISAASFLAALIVTHRLTERELGVRAADATVLLLSLAPLSLFFTAIYTESLFLALSVGAVAAARAGRWRLACGLGALATLTRPTGVLLIVALALIRVREAPRGRRDPSLLAVLTLPGALVAYMVALAVRGYPPLTLLTVQRHWGRVMIGPLGTLAAALWHAGRGLVRVIAGQIPIYHPELAGPFPPPVQSIVLLVAMALACAAAITCIRRLPAAYGAYAVLVVVVCISTAGDNQPLWSFDRFALTIFPLWMAAGAWLAQRRRLLAPTLVVSAALLAFYTLQFSSWSFVA